MSGMHGFVVGFTGTRSGMTALQKVTFNRLVQSLQIKEFHHGDCVGADYDAHEAVRRLLPECEIIAHPPQSDKYRAYVSECTVLDPKPYLERNRDIVSASGLIIVVPKQDSKPTNMRGQGTWWTFEHAWGEGRLILAISVKGILRAGCPNSKGPW